MVRSYIWLDNVRYSRWLFTWGFTSISQPDSKKGQSWMGQYTEAKEVNGTLPGTNMEVDGMAPWKTIFHSRQVVVHFHVRFRECSTSLPTLPLVS